MVLKGTECRSVILLQKKNQFMAKRIHANRKASVQARFNISVINPIIVKALL